MIDEKNKNNNDLVELKAGLTEFTRAVSFIKDQHNTLNLPLSTVPPENSWNFLTFEKFINQRFSDLSIQLRERYEAQQIGLSAALAAAEKAVNAALIAAEKAVDKAESSQQLRNEAQNEFRKSLSDLSGLMWTIKEGTLAIESMRREFTASQDNIIKLISTLDVNKTEALDFVRRALEARVGMLETGAANIQGRIWAVSALFAIAAVVVNVVVKFVGN